MHIFYAVIHNFVFIQNILVDFVCTIIMVKYIYEKIIWVGRLTCKNYIIL